MADFNGDGIVDLAVANYGGSTATVVLTQLTQTATATANGLSPEGGGTHNVEASYSGDPNYSASVSTATPLTGQPIATSLKLSANPLRSDYGQQVELVVTLTPGSTSGYSTAEEAVTFYNGTTVLGTAPLASGIATLNLTSLPVGLNHLTASYTGDTNFQASSAPVLPFAVNPEDPTITWSNPALIGYGTLLSAAQLNATASVPGTFAYSPAAGALGVGQHILSVTFTPADTTNYTKSSGTVTLVVNPAVLTVSANSLSEPYGTNAALSSTIRGFVNGDTVAVVSGTPVLGSAVTSTSLPGAYPITVGAGTLSAANYTFNLVGGTYTVTYTGSAPLSGSACKGSYDGTFNGNLIVSAGETCIFVGAVLPERSRRMTEHWS